MYSVLNGKPLEQWKVTELKEELKKRKLPVRGLKDELIKRLDFAITSEKEDNKEETAQNEEGNEPVTEENVDNGVDSETQVTEENVDNGVNSETQVNVETAQPVDAYHTEVVEDDWVNIVEPQVQMVNTTVVQDDGSVVEEAIHKETEDDGAVAEEAIHKETDSTVGKIGTLEPQISNVEEAQSVNTPVTDDVRENSESKRVEIDEAMVDAGLVDDSSSVMGQGDVQDATDSTAADVVVSVETNVTVTQSVVTEVTEVTQSVVTEVLSSDEELQNKEADREPEVPNHPSGDSMHSLSNQNSQVSEVSRDLGFQVRSESISSDCVSIIEKNELKDNLNADNFHIEQNVVMPEMVQPSSNDVSPDDGALRSLDGQQPCENQDSMEGLDDTSATVNLDQKNYVTDASEKLDLDGDESMEEDIVDSRHVDSKHNSDEMGEKNSLPEVNDVNKGTHVGVKIDSLSDKGSSAEGMISHAVPAEKRKLEDQEVGKNNETPKRQRRWNSETLKVPELQASTLKSPTTPKDAFSSDAPKRSFAKSDSTLSPKIARERVVPPSAKPPTTSLRIDNFLRPFTLKAVQELLAKTGTVCSFWMDHIKTHCYVTYSSVEEATETRNALYNLQWPTNGGKLLAADFVDPQDVKMRAEAPAAAPAPAPVSTTPKTPKSAQLSSRPPTEASPRQAVQKKQLPPPPPLTSEPPPPIKEHLPLPPPPPLPQNEDPPIVTLDDLFRKTVSTPRIYFLPLSEEQVAAKLARQGKNTSRAQ
ncbi:hypothetical protein MKW94_009745 [Papaver nudicaule]|uniref:SAP domain-containing protein n=1 Tax=Papaver nudicaule TaxID=74823 RepID=A0AA41V333_PAPNU|nr:hypothetical protein [Papaver nudicaule]